MMKSPQKFMPTLQYNRLAHIEKLMEHNPSAGPISYVPPQRTESDEALYEFELFELKHGGKQQIDRERQAKSKNIELTLALTAQNDEMLRKMQEVKELLSSEQLKSDIFKKRHHENQIAIAELKDKKERLFQQASKIKTLNQSAIPNKSVELNTTNNTNAWLNEFLNKSELENLWAKQREKQAKTNNDSKVKSYTIDLSTFMNSARVNNQKVIEKRKVIETKAVEQKLKPKGANKILSSRPLSIKQGQKVEIMEKQKLLNKNLSQLRTMKKAKCNPEL